MRPLRHLSAWKALEAHFRGMRNFDMRAALNPERVIGKHDSSTLGLIADIRRRRGLST